MCKPTTGELIVLTVFGLGPLLVLMSTVYGLSGAALAGVVTVLAVLVEGRRSTHAESRAGS